MTNKLEQDKAIIADAPDGNYKSVKILGDKPAIWVPDNYRSLADIRESIADKERIAELEKENLKLKMPINLADRITFTCEQLEKRDLEQQIKGINAIQEDIETAFEFSMCSIEDIIHYKILAIRKQIWEVEHNVKD